MSSSESEIFARYLRGDLAPEELQRLETMLRQDPALRRAYLEYANLNAALEEQAAFSESEWEDSPLPPAPQFAEGTTLPGARNRLLRLRRWVLPIAAGLALAAGIALWGSAVPAWKSKTASVEAVVLVSDDVPSPDGRLLRHGEKVMISRVRFDAGWLKLGLPNGVTLDFHGPVEGHFETSTRFRLVAGRLNVDVGEHGRGFMVVTKTAEVIDLGTRFGVDVAKSGGASVAVFSGEVEVRPAPARNRAGLRLTEGEAVQVQAGRGPTRLMAVAVPDVLGQDSSLSRKSLVVDVTDNISDQDFRQFYGIVPGGMREGMKAHTTMPRIRWRPDAGKTFPAELIGADIVQTFHWHRKERDLEITLRTDRPASVYVMIDMRHPAPGWLHEAFIDTGLQVRTGPWNRVHAVADIAPDAEDNVYVTYRVWRRDLREPARVALGPPTIEAENLRVMYGIAVKRLDL